VLLRTCSTHGADRIGDPTQAHMVAIDARAPLYDGGICTRIDCVSLGVVVNRDGERFYDEGEDFWPKRYAIWGRLVAQQPGQVAYSIIDAKAIGPLHAAGVPGRAGRHLPELARKLGLDEAPSCAPWRLQRRLPRRHLRPHGAGRLPHRRPDARPRRTGRARSTPRPSTATRSSPASPSPTWA
jgi:hypothetical protein